MSLVLDTSNNSILYCTTLAKSKYKHKHSTWISKMYRYVGTLHNQLLTAATGRFDSETQSEDTIDYEE